jgi:hypothetical protein
MDQISRWRQRISRSRKIRGLLENRLMKPTVMRVGSVVKQYMFCGKASCGCHQDPKKKHGPYYYLSYKVGGRSRYKYLGKAASSEVARAVKINEHEKNFTKGLVRQAQERRVGW